MARLLLREVTESKRMSDLIRFTVAPDSDPKRDEIRALLGAHLAREHTRRARHFFVHLLAVLGGLIALCVQFPQFTPAQGREVLLALWSACCVCAAAVSAVEWSWWRRETRLLSVNEDTSKAH